MDYITNIFYSETTETRKGKEKVAPTDSDDSEKFVGVDGSKCDVVPIFNKETHQKEFVTPKQMKQINWKAYSDTPFEFGLDADDHQNWTEDEEKILNQFREAKDIDLQKCKKDGLASKINANMSVYSFLTDTIREGFKLVYKNPDQVDVEAKKGLKKLRCKADAMKKLFKSYVHYFIVMLMISCVTAFTIGPLVYPIIIFCLAVFGYRWYHAIKRNMEDLKRYGLRYGVTVFDRLAFEYITHIGALSIIGVLCYFIVKRYRSHKEQLTESIKRGYDDSFFTWCASIIIDTFAYAGLATSFFTSLNDVKYVVKAVCRRDVWFSVRLFQRLLKLWNSSVVKWKESASLWQFVPHHINQIVEEDFDSDDESELASEPFRPRLLLELQKRGKRIFFVDDDDAPMSMSKSADINMYGTMSRLNWLSRVRWVWSQLEDFEKACVIIITCTWFIILVLSSRALFKFCIAKSRVFRSKESQDEESKDFIEEPSTDEDEKPEIPQNEDNAEPEAEENTQEPSPKPTEKSTPKGKEKVVSEHDEGRNKGKTKRKQRIMRGGSGKRRKGFSRNDLLDLYPWLAHVSDQVEMDNMYQAGFDYDEETDQFYRRETKRTCFKCDKPLSKKYPDSLFCPACWRQFPTCTIGKCGARVVAPMNHCRRHEKTHDVNGKPFAAAQKGQKVLVSREVHEKLSQQGPSAPIVESRQVDSPPMSPNFCLDRVGIVKLNGKPWHTCHAVLGRGECTAHGFKKTTDWEKQAWTLSFKGTDYPIDITSVEFVPNEDRALFKIPAGCAIKSFKLANISAVDNAQVWFCGMIEDQVKCSGGTAVLSGNRLNLTGTHTCTTEYGSSGGAVILANSHHLIGVHTSRSEDGGPNVFQSVIGDNRNVLTTKN
jgi:hypothetical protein